MSEPWVLPEGRANVRRSPEDVLRSVRRFVGDELGAAWDVQLALENAPYRRPFALVRGVTPAGVFGSTRERYDMRQTVNVSCYPLPDPPDDPEAALLAAHRCQASLLHAFQEGGEQVLPTPEGVAASVVQPDGGSELAAGTYSYRVTAMIRRTRGETLAAAAVSAAPASPGDAVRLEWDEVAGADRYRVYRGDAGSETLLAETDASPWVDTGQWGATSLVTVPDANRAFTGDARRVPLYDYGDVPARQTTPKRSSHDYIRVEDVAVNVIADPDDPSMYTVVADVRCAWTRRGRLPSDRMTTGKVLGRPESGLPWPVLGDA